jgi:S1-C subfamily serine protease
MYRAHDFAYTCVEMRQESQPLPKWRIVMGNTNVVQEFSNATAAAVEKAGKSVLAVNARRHMLSAGIYWREGLIVTANHAVRRADEIEILLPGDRTATASIVGRDPGTDLALLKLTEPRADLPLPEIGNPTTMKVGNLVVAVGRVEAGPRASLGIIGVLGGPWRTWHGSQVDQLIRLGFGLHPTLSGGPLVDIEGRCLGMNTTGLSRSLGVTIPPVTINRAIDLLLQKGRIPQGYLGVGLWPVALPSSMQSKLDLTESRGLMVQHVEPGSPADKAGMLMGDLLVRLNSTPVSDLDELHSRLTADTVGTSAEAVVVRGGALAKLKIQIEERPQSYDAGSHRK